VKRFFCILGLGALLVSAGSAPAAKLGRATIVGKVDDDSDKGRHRRVYVNVGNQKWTLHVPEDARIEHAGRKVSIHEVSEGMWVKARGVRIGNLRLKAFRVDVVGDHLAFRKSRTYRKSQPAGYWVPYVMK
jgi:hypothetical protein